MSKTYGLELLCDRCAKTLLEDIAAGQAITAPKCPNCDAEVVWPTAAELAAIYGAPGNWPIEPRDGLPQSAEELAAA